MTPERTEKVMQSMDLQKVIMAVLVSHEPKVTGDQALAALGTAISEVIRITCREAMDRTDAAQKVYTLIKNCVEAA